MKNLSLGVMLLAVLLGACNGAEIDLGSDVGEAGASGEVAPSCVSASPEAGGDATLCPGLASVQIVTMCDAPAANPYPRDKFSAIGCDETPFQGGRVWCCAPSAPAVTVTP